MCGVWEPKEKFQEKGSINCVSFAKNLKEKNTGMATSFGASVMTDKEQIYGKRLEFDWE